MVDNSNVSDAMLMTDFGAVFFNNDDSFDHFVTNPIIRTNFVTNF